MTKKTWKVETEAKTLTKCLPYCLFPWADTDAFARGRPPTQSNTHHMIYSKTQRGRRERERRMVVYRCFIDFGKIPQQIDGWVIYIFCFDHLNIRYFTAAAFGLMSGCHHETDTAMIQVWEKGILMVFICNHSRIRPGWHCNILSEKDPHTCHLVQKNNTDCVFCF